MRIGLFIPCYIDALFPEVGIATLELLERFGHEVVYPRDQQPRGSAPPTPPYVRVRIRRFGGLSSTFGRQGRDAE